MLLRLAFSAPLMRAQVRQQLRPTLVRAVAPLMQRRCFAEAADAAAPKKPTSGKKAAAKKAAAGGQEQSSKERQEQAMLDESDQYFDWEAFVRWMDAPAPADPRTKEQKLADEQVCRIYSKNTVKNFVKQQQFFDTMVRAQMEAVATLPEALRERALVFDPILPPIHPRIGAPKQYPIASRLQTQRLDVDNEEDANVSSAAKRRKAKVDAAQDEDDAGLRRDKDE